MKNLVVKTLILIATLIGTMIPISVLSFNNFEEQNSQIRIDAPDILGFSTKYNTAKNRVELSFYLDTIDITDVTSQDLYFSTEENPSTPLGPSSYGTKVRNDMTIPCVELNVFNYNGDLQFDTDYWFKIVSPSGVEKSGGTTLPKGEVVETNIEVIKGYDTISFKGDFTQPTLDYYDEIEWTITDKSNPANIWSDIILFTNPNFGTTESFDELMVDITNGITPSTTYDVLIIANEKDDDDSYEIYNDSIITDPPPEVDKTSESYVIEPQVDYFEMTYSFKQPSDVNYSVKDFIINVYDESDAIVSTTNIPVIEGSLALNEGTVKIEDISGSIEDNTNYTIIGTLEYESIPPVSYAYSREAFREEKITLERPIPIVEEISDSEIIDHDSIEKDFKLTQPNYDSKPRYDAEEIKVTLFKTGQTISEQEKIFDKTHFEKPSFLVEFDSLEEAQSYTLQFSYYILDDQNLFNQTWTDIESFAFETIAIPRPTGTIMNVRTTSYSVEWDLNYTQASSDDQYNATDIEWFIFEDESSILSEKGKHDNGGTPLPDSLYGRTSTIDLKPETDYTIIEKYEAPFDDNLPNHPIQHEIARHTFTTKVTPRPMASIVIKDLTSYSVSWDLNYTRSGDEDKFDAKEIEWAILEEGISIPIDTGLESGNPISNGKYTRTSTIDLKPETNYIIVEKYKAGYDSQADWHDLSIKEFTTPSTPMPTGEIILDDLDISANSVSWDLNYTRSGDEDKFDAKEIEWAILEEGISIPIDTGLESGNPISSDTYTRSSEKLKPDTNYTIEESYKADYDSQNEQHELDTIEFTTPSQPKGTFVINDLWVGYNTLEFDSIFTQPEHKGFLINGFDWRILDSSLNFIMGDTFLVNLNAPTNFIINETDVNNLEINNEYTLEVRWDYQNPTWNDIEEWDIIKIFETYKVVMPSEDTLKLVEGKEELTIEFDMFNVPRDWETNQRSKKEIDNNDLDTMSFDQVHFSLFTVDDVLIDENIIINEGINNLNEEVTLSTTFKNLESDTDYKYSISVWRENDVSGELELHQHAFVNGVSSGDISTLYKFPLQYVIYPLIIIIILVIIFLIYKDLSKQQKLRNKIVSDIFSLVEDLKTSLTPYVVPVGYEEYKTLIKEPKEVLMEKLTVEDKEWDKKDSKKTLAKLITGFTDEEIEKYEEQSEFEYKKDEETYDELIGEYSTTLLKQQSKIKRFFNEKILKPKPEVGLVEENNIELIPEKDIKEIEVSPKPNQELATEELEVKEEPKEDKNEINSKDKADTKEAVKPKKPTTKKTSAKPQKTIKTKKDTEVLEDKDQKVVVDDE